MIDREKNRDAGMRRHCGSSVFEYARVNELQQISEMVSHRKEYEILIQRNRRKHQKCKWVSECDSVSLWNFTYECTYFPKRQIQCHHQNMLVGNVAEGKNVRGENLSRSHLENRGFWENGVEECHRIVLKY